MKRTVTILLLALGCAGWSSAQDASDALRYSRIFYNGTARFDATAGAFGAVGADFSTLATNPAGIGLYKTTEFTISPSVRISKNSSDYNGFSADRNDVNFALANSGFVFSAKIPNSKSGKGLRYLNFGFGINRQNDFNGETYILGPNHTSSLLNTYTNTWNSQNWISPSDINYYYPFDIGPAYGADLIYYDSLNGRYTTDVPNGGVFQEKVIQTTGSINEMDLSMGGNIGDKLYFGITMGVPWIRYYETTWYTEGDSGDSIPYLNYFNYNYTFETHGTGFNIKGGVIYRPANWVRIGVAVHSPTWYGNMRDIWASSMYASYDSVLNKPVQYSPQGNYDYHLTTPFRAIGSIAFFVSQYGFISGEYEFVNYNQARFNSSDGSFGEVNQTIQNNYKIPVNFRIGSEWRVAFMRFRAGFGYYGAPTKSSDLGTRYTITGGVGFFSRHFFSDISYQYARTKSDYYLYDPALVQPASLILRSNTLTATFGMRF